MKQLYCLSIAVVMSVLAVKAEGTNDPLTALAPHVKTAVDKELEKLEMLLKDSKRKWNISFPERVLESGEVIEKSAKVDIDHHEYRSSMGTNFVAIYRFPSIDDASASMRRWIAQPPIQPPLEIPGLGDAAVRFPGKTLEATGSLFFRRGTLAVHIGAGRLNIVEKVAHIIDAAIITAKVP